MLPDKKDASANAEDSKWPAAGSGNASNPSPHNDAVEPAGNQLLDGRAEKYLREVASIEDVPDAQDQQELDKTIQESKREGY